MKIFIFVLGLVLFSSNMVFAGNTSKPKKSQVVVEVYVPRTPVRTVFRGIFIHPRQTVVIVQQ